MCTVTFIPVNNKIFITHSRDEKITRSKALLPKEYIINGYTLLFPKDGHAGGTWIAINKNGTAAVLLNGSVIKHVHKPPYKKSRGLAFLDIIASDDLYLSYHNVDLNNIEPFTVIIWNNDSLYECRWDGTEKHVKQLDALKPYTWSSVTLYNAQVIAARKNMFENWLLKHTRPAMDEIIQYHLSHDDSDTNNDPRINHDDTVVTVSITSMEIGAGKCRMKYMDLQENTNYLQQLYFTKAPVIK